MLSECIADFREGKLLWGHLNAIHTCGFTPTGTTSIYTIDREYCGQPSGWQIIANRYECQTLFCDFALWYYTTTQDLDEPMHKDDYFDLMQDHVWDYGLKDVVVA